MIFLAGASLLLSLIIGVFLTLVFLPSAQRKTAGLLFRLFVGGGLGIGVTSCIYFVCLLTGLTRYTAAIDLVVCLVIRPDLFYALQKKGPPETGGPFSGIAAFHPQSGAFRQRRR